MIRHFHRCQYHASQLYKLVFNDPELKRLAPSTLEIGTYTTDTVKIVACSVLLSCTTTLVLESIQPYTRLDYLPHRSSLITSSVDHPRTTKRVSVHSSRKEESIQSSKQVVTVPDQQQLVPKLMTSKE